jgi:hypothetical protein
LLPLVRRKPYGPPYSTILIESRLKQTYVSAGGAAIILEKRLFEEDLLLGRRWTTDGGRKERRNGGGAYRQDQYLPLCCLVKAHHAFHASRRTVWTPGLLNQWIHFLNFQGLQRKRAPLWLAHSIPSSMPAHLSLSASVCLPLCLSLPHYLTL